MLDRTASADFFAEVDRLFFAAGLAHLTPIGAPSAVLGALHGRGYRLGIMTNDAEANARAQAARLGIDHVLDFIAGYNSGFGAKPDAAPVLAFAQAVGAEPREVAVVGDAVHDLVAARAAGAVAVGVLSGPTPRDLLAPHADALLELDCGSAGLAHGAVRSDSASQKPDQQVAHLLGLLLLRPVPGPVHQMKAHHLRAGTALHSLHGARGLVGAPVALAGDEA